MNKASGREAARVMLIAVVLGALCGFAAWAFIAADHLGVQFFWHQLPAMVPGVPAWALSVAVVILMTVLAATVIVVVGKRPFDTGSAEAEYDAEKRMDYTHVLSGALFSLFSLFSGAAVGPEAPLTDINGGLGTWVAERLRLKPDLVKVLTYAGVAGAFGAFFGAAPVGALLAAELIDKRSLLLDRTALVAGLGAGASAWVVYYALGGQKVPVLLSFANAAEPTVAQLGIAIVLGLVGGLLGLLYGAAFVKARSGLAAVRKRPWVAALAGGVAVAIASVVSPYLLFSGQEQVPDLIEKAATLGVLVLIALGVLKLVLSIWCLSTGYFGGPIFPLIFAGTSFGLAVHLLLPGIPEGVTVLAIVAGMTACAAVAPISVTIFLVLMSGPQYISVIAIGTVAAFIVRQFVAPTVPSAYWNGAATPEDA